jgi:hypothetical protein
VQAGGSRSCKESPLLLSWTHNLDTQARALEVSRQVRYVLNITDWLWSFRRGIFFRLKILPGVQHVVKGQVVWQVLGHCHAAEYLLEVSVGPAGVAVQLDSGVGWVGRKEDRDWASGGDTVKHFGSQVPLVG